MRARHAFPGDRVVSKCHVEAYGESDMSRVMLFFNSKLGKHRTQIAIYSRWRKKVRPVYAAGLW